MRIGQGFDVHRFSVDSDAIKKPLILMGCTIPYHKYLLGHSDADVMVHALMDALLGAAGLGDIGQHFPDTDPAYLNANSTNLLKLVMMKVIAAGWEVVNVDTCLIGDNPKIGPYREAMRIGIASILDISPLEVNVKATTTEQLGFTGRGDGLAAQAIVLLKAL